VTDKLQDRQTAYRRRKRNRLVLVPIEVGISEVRALQSLELLHAGAPSKAELAAAVQRFLSCAPAIADIPKRFYP
jgi:hypothetical protein